MARGEGFLDECTSIFDRFRTMRKGGRDGRDPVEVLRVGFRGGRGEDKGGGDESDDPGIEGRRFTTYVHAGTSGMHQ